MLHHKSTVILIELRRTFYIDKWLFLAVCLAYLRFAEQEVEKPFFELKLKSYGNHHIHIPKH